MTEFSSHLPGTFSWPELATTDQQAAVTFYRELFGWELNDQPLGPGRDAARLPLGRCLWGGAEADVARILVSEEKDPDFDGEAYVGLHHPRIS